MRKEFPMMKVTAMGFAERTAERQHNAADDADPGVGNDHIAHHFPGGAADAIGGFP